MTIIEIPIILKVTLPFTEEEEAMIELGATYVRPVTKYLIRDGGFRLDEYLLHSEVVKDNTVTTVIELISGGSMSTILTAKELVNLINKQKQSWITKCLVKVYSSMKKLIRTPMNSVRSMFREQSL